MVLQLIMEVVAQIQERELWQVTKTHSITTTRGNKALPTTEAVLGIHQTTGVHSGTMQVQVGTIVATRAAHVNQPGVTLQADGAVECAQAASQVEAEVALAVVAEAT